MADKERKVVDFMTTVSLKVVNMTILHNGLKSERVDGIHMKIMRSSLRLQTRETSVKRRAMLPKKPLIGKCLLSA